MFSPSDFQTLHPRTIQHLGAVLHGVGSSMLGEASPHAPPTIAPSLHPATLHALGNMLKRVASGQPHATELQRVSRPPQYAPRGLMGDAPVEGAAGAPPAPNSGLFAFAGGK